MHPLMTRITELVGPSIAKQLATEFGGQHIYFPARQASAHDALVLAEFNGDNHHELAHKHHVSVAWVYRLVAQSHREAVAEALQTVLGSSPQVLWAAPLTQLALLPGLEAVLRAAEKARALGCQDRLAAALVILPEAPAASAQLPQPTPVAPAETRPGTPAPAGTAPHPSVVPPSHSN